MIYEIYDNPEWLSFDLMDRVMMHANETLQFPKDSYFVIEFTEDVSGCGDCDVVDGVVEININPNISRKETMVTLFHELVHAEQILKKRLIVGEGNTPSQWCNVIYTTTYEDSPWEIEAYKLEKQLMRTFNGIR